MERRQSRISFELVMDAYQRLVKAEDEKQPTRDSGS
jgi:hypothetical protein